MRKSFPVFLDRWRAAPRPPGTQAPWEPEALPGAPSGLLGALGAIGAPSGSYGPLGHSRNPAKLCIILASWGLPEGVPIIAFN